jgi:uncharacterized membrane protein
MIRPKMSFGEMVADKTTLGIGSWAFIIIQLIIIFIWITLNITGIFKFDPFPFVFLNLALSFQAAFTAPIIMMSQNRQNKLDKLELEDDYKINKLAESEIEIVMKELRHIQAKIDKLR